MDTLTNIFDPVATDAEFDDEGVTPATRDRSRRPLHYSVESVFDTSDIRASVYEPAHSFDSSETDFASASKRRRP